MPQLDDLPSGLPIEDISRNRHPVHDPLVQHMTIAQSEMQRFHESELQGYEAIVQVLMQKISEMTQGDQGSAMRTEELERQCNMMQAAMAHMNQVHQGPRMEYEVGMMRMEQHVRDHELAESLSAQLGRLRATLGGKSVRSGLEHGEGVRKARME